MPQIYCQLPANGSYILKYIIILSSYTNTRLLGTTDAKGRVTKQKGGTKNEEPT
jgi:hypothetical protein